MPVPRPPAPGTFGPRPPTHQALFAVAPPYAMPSPYTPAYHAAPPPYTPQQPAWDPALFAALQQAPAPGSYAGGGDWFMDTGASSHMAAHPGNLSHSVGF